MSDFPALAGRDAELPPWLLPNGTFPTTKPKFDSVVVMGTGIGALVMAGRLARSDQLSGRVSLAGEPVSESRRLIGGVTLRARALDYFAAAMSSSVPALTRAMFGDRREQAEGRTQYFLKASKKRGRIALGKPTLLMGERDAERPLVYGVRNSRMNRVLFDELARFEVPRHPQKKCSAQELASFARGSNPLIVNGNPGLIEGATNLAGHTPFEPRAFVVTYQVPFVSRSEILRDAQTLICAHLAQGAADLAVFFPFIDPLTPTATYYGNIVRVVEPDGGFDKAAAVNRMKDVMSELAPLLGLEAIDPHETAGEGMFPAFPWGPVEDSQEGVLDLHRIVAAGTPIITADGMLRAGIAGLVGAEAILAGLDPNPLMNRALRTYDRFNRIMRLELTRLAPFIGPFLDLAPRLVLEFPHRAAAKRDMWSGRLPL